MNAHLCKAGLVVPLWQDVGRDEASGVPERGGREPQEAKDMGLFIIEVNMGSRLEHISFCSKLSSFWADILQSTSSPFVFSSCSLF